MSTAATVVVSNPDELTVTVETFVGTATFYVSEAEARALARQLTEHADKLAWHNDGTP